MRPLATMQLGISSAEGVVRSLKGSFPTIKLVKLSTGGLAEFALKLRIAY
jgi:hypothetical protein